MTPPWVSESAPHGVPVRAGQGARGLPGQMPPVSLRLADVALRAGHRLDGRLLVDRLELMVRPGERWVVLGPNGAGKSTLLAAMAGLAPPAAGSIEIDGRALPQWRLAPLARRRAWCPQFWSDPFAATVAETVALAMPGSEVDRSVAERDAVLSVMRALDLEALAEVDVRALSGGERQRVAIATTLLQGAPLLLLDEPTSHLDLWHQQALLAVLRGHADAGGCVVASVHDLNLAWDLATHAVLLDGRGRAWCGVRTEVLTAARLGEAFGVPVNRVEVCGHERFWIGPAAGGGGR